MLYKFYDYIKNKYFDDLSSLSAVQREAEIFVKTCAEIPIDIKYNDIIPGRYGTDNENEYKLSENREFLYKDCMSEEEHRIINVYEKSYGLSLNFDRGHCLIDYGYIINFGLKGYAEKVEAELLKDNSKEKNDMLSAMIKSVEGVKIYMERFSVLADEMYEKYKNPKFLKMRDAIKKVPYEKAENFYEAVVSVWTMHSLMPISENCWASISLGRFDKYMFPFYEKETDKDEARRVIINFFELLNSYGDAACAFNIGGLSESGKDEINELSRILIEIENDICLPSPIFVLRVNEKTEDNIIDSLINKKLFSAGQPTFYGEESCIEALLDRGVPKEDVHRFSVNSCMGLYMSGEEIASMWSIVLNMYLPLEMAINGGKAIKYDLPHKFENAGYKLPDNKEELFCLYEKYLAGMCTVLFELACKNAENIAVNLPNPLLSMMTSGCIEAGQDRAVAAKYNTETIETMALANAANAITAIDELVFKKHKYTLDNLIEATKAEFAGYELILNDIKSCTKYGSGDVNADENAKRICHIISDICKKESKNNRYFLPSLHTLSGNVDFGDRVYTSLDGRKMGESIAKNAGPTMDARGNAVTEILRSAAYIDQKLFSGGQPVDLYFDPALLENEESRVKIRELVKVYFKMGGLQLQVNSVDVNLLEKAYEAPGEYENVVVRIGGYSLKFTELTREQQREFIERFSAERDR